MGFLDNTSITVDAILTKKGRELLARGQNEFKITKFALADDEVDYNLYNPDHDNGSNYYGAVIENMPLLEAFVDENQVMRYKLVTLPKETAKLPILELPNASLSFNGPGITQTITPNTRNGVDSAYTFILQDASIANITPVVARSGGGAGSSVDDSTEFIKNRERGILPDGTFDPDFLAPNATTPVFLNEAERKKSLTVTSKSVNIIARSILAETSTNVTIVGLDTGASFTLPITVKADPSKA
tara:strand:+ start:1173 stop:1901 length:729 start_codon:yes stop_codon:yes gene_type:complete